MRQSPQALAGELKEMLCTYLETTHRVSNEAVALERGKLLRNPGVIGQVPSSRRRRALEWDLGSVNCSTKPFLPNYPS